jgi:predicted nucleic acid-binding protein
VRRLFLDANVLFTAAHNPHGKAALVIQLATAGHWEVVTSVLAIEEARRNLERKYPQCLPDFAALLDGIEQVPSGDGTHCPAPLPSKDAPILEAAIHCQATHLLTGDIKDFGPYMNRPEACAGITIQTVAQFLERL